MGSSISKQLLYKRKKLYDYALAFLAFLMPLIVKGFPIIIISVSFFGLAYLFIAYKKVGKSQKDYYLLPYNIIKDGFIKIFKEKNAMFFMLLLFVFDCLSVLYSEDLETAGDKIILKSCYLYFPLIFALTKWDKKKLIRVLDFFVAGCFFQVIISLVDAYLASGFMFKTSEFYYVKLSYNLHPSYAAFLINIGVVFNAIRTIQFLKKGTQLYLVILRLLLFVIFFIFTLMLSSKAGLICLLVSFFGIVIYSCYSFKSFKPIIICFFCFIILGIGSINFLGDKAINKFSDLSYFIKNKNNVRNKSVGTSSTQTRWILWENSFYAIKKSFFIGHGIGDGKFALQNQLSQNGEVFVLRKNYNAHNQFLEIALSTGIIGLFFFVIILFRGTFIYTGGFKFISILLGIVIIINLSVESMMEKQIGSISITWLICLLVSARDIFKTTFKFDSTTS